MTDIVKKLKEMPSFYSLTGVPHELIEEAEKTLKLKFAYEYCQYLAAFGVVSANGHEFTGICQSARLNVINVTFAEREANSSVPLDLYVIEQANIDGIVIWQSASGEVYQSMPGAPMIKLCDSIIEYINLK